MRIVSLNAWGGAMFDALADWLPRCGADVICLQEVTRAPGLTGWTRFADADRSLPQRADLFADVRGLLPEHDGVFLASDAGPVHDAAGDRHRQDFGIAVFVHRRLTVIAHHSTFVHGSFAEHDEWPTDGRPRVAHAVRLVERQPSRTVTVAHLHGLRDAAGKADSPARHAQAARLAELVASTARPGDLVVVGGDLNVLPDSDTFAILREIGLTDLVGTADTRTASYTKPVRHADYLLVSDPTAVRAFEVLAAPEVSDHRPLVLDI